MAGTRLYIQSLALVQLLVLAAWSFHHGLCCNDDTLCHRLFGLLDEKYDSQFDLPPLDPPHMLPPVQVDQELHPDISLVWERNAKTSAVCDEPESLIVQEHPVWWCLSNDSEPRLVLRRSSLVIHCKEHELPMILKPEIAPALPCPLKISLILEESNHLAAEAQKWAQILAEGVAQLNDWPNVETLEVSMKVVPPQTSKWVVKESLSEDGGEAKPILPKLSESQASMLLDKHSESSDDGHHLIVYIPATQTQSEEVMAFQGADSQLLIVGGWNADTAHRWLAIKMGIPSVALNSDGSFPRWYDTWFWQSVSVALAKQVTTEHGRVKHLLRLPLSLEVSNSFQEHFEALNQLRIQLKLALTSSAIERDFPLEHYVAIFSPLLFPLLLPFLLGTIKEYRRYKEKISKHEEHGDQS